jgi:hypothetical protein
MWIKCPNESRYTWHANERIVLRIKTRKPRLVWCVYFPGEAVPRFEGTRRGCTEFAKLNS